METVLFASENRLRQTEEALVVERLARRTAEVAQQVVKICPAGVGVEEIGRLEMFSGDGDLNGRVNSMPWSQWSLTVLSYFGELNQTATRFLQRVEIAEDPIITDNTMAVAGRWQAVQLCCVLALTCRKRALQVVQQVPRGYGFAAWRQLCRKFGPHPPVRSRGMLQVLLSLTKSAEPKRLVRQWRNRRKVCKEQSGNEESDRQSARPTTRDRARQETAEFLEARHACAVSGSAKPTDLVSLGSREGDESAKPKEHFSSKKPGHSKCECRYFSAVRKKRLAQQDKADRHTAGDPEMGKTEFLGERGTSVLSIIPERDICLFHEDDNDQSVYPCPSPLIGGGSDDLEDLMVLPCQAWFDAEAPKAFECIRDSLRRTVVRAKCQVKRDRWTKVRSKSRKRSGSVRDRRFPEVFTKRVASATSDHGSWILCPRRVHRPCVDTEDPSAVETCQVLHESSETRAVNGVLENLDTCGLDEVLLKRDDGSAIEILVNTSKGRTRRKDGGREEFEELASIK